MKKKVSKVEASIKKQDEKKIVEKVALPTITEKKEILLKENYKEYPRKQKNETHRDFRYGGPFVWDYEPLSPDPKIIVDVIRKTPEFFILLKIESTHKVIWNLIYSLQSTCIEKKNMD